MPVIYLVRLSPDGFSGLPSDMGRATLMDAGLHDLTTPKTHGPCVATRPVGSYPAFSPLPPFLVEETRRRFFSSALLHPRGQLSVRKWDALCCPDFPPAQTAQATGRPTASWVQRYENLSVWQSVVRKSVGSAVSSLLFLFYISLFLLRFKSVSPPFQVRFFFV